MKRFLLLLLPLVFLLAACGGKPAASAVPMPIDGGDEAQIQLDPNDPLTGYLDLRQLPEETAAAASQALALTSQDNDVQATLQKAVGDSGLLYLTLEVTYPDRVDLSDAPQQLQDNLVLAEGTITDPSQMPETSFSDGCHITCQGSQVSEHTINLLFTVSCDPPLLTPGKEVTLLYRDHLGQSAHLFSWTLQTEAPARQAELVRQDGTVVGSAALSLFSAHLTLQDAALAQLTAAQLQETFAFLDASGQALPSFQAAAVHQEENALSLTAQSFVPTLPDQIHAVQLGDQTIQVRSDGQPS